MLQRGKHAAPRPTGRQTRIFRRAIPLAVALVLVMGAVAWAADLLKTAEVEGSAVTEVTIQQGQSANVDVLLTASGAIHCDIGIEEDPSTAKIHTDYELADDGTFTSETLGAQTLNVRSDGEPGGGGNCGSTWDGAPNAVKQPINIAVDPATPPDTYTLHITNAAQAGRVTITNPGPTSGSGQLTPRLGDKDFSIDVVVTPAGDTLECSFGSFGQPFYNAENGTDPKMSAFKFGARGVIPLKVQLTCNMDLGLIDTQAKAHEVGDVTLVLRRISSQVGNDIGDLDDPITGSANTGNVFRFDDPGDQYIYNANIKGLSPGVYEVSVSGPGGANATNWFAVK